MTVEPAGASIIYDMSELKSKTARLPPRWFIRLFWIIHRGVYRATKGRFGLWRPKPGGWGAMCLRTIGRRTGRVHPVVLFVSIPRATVRPQIAQLTLHSPSTEGFSTHDGGPFKPHFGLSGKILS